MRLPATQTVAPERSRRGFAATVDRLQKVVTRRVAKPAHGADTGPYAQADHGEEPFQSLSVACTLGSEISFSHPMIVAFKPSPCMSCNTSCKEQRPGLLIRVVDERWTHAAHGSQFLARQILDHPFALETDGERIQKR